MVRRAIMLEAEQRFGALAVAAREIGAGTFDDRVDCAVRRLADGLDERVAPARDGFAGGLGADAVDEQDAELVRLGGHGGLRSAKIGKSRSLAPAALRMTRRAPLLKKKKTRERRTSAEAALPAQYDQVRQAWIIAGPNPNLRIVGNFGGPVQPGVIGFGFVVSILQSFIQVARVNGRCILRDGHHRAIGFLKRGIETVPVITRDYGEFEELGIGPGLLPTAAYLGPRPPLLVDYFDDVVSADVSLPAFQRMIVIHGLEL